MSVSERKSLQLADAEGISLEDILAGVSGVLEHFVDAAKDDTPDKTAFDGDETMPVREYLYRMARAGLCSKDCFIIALVYAERILQSHPKFTISEKNVHRLILVSTMLASKVLDDFYCRNVYYANAGGLAIQVLNELELTFVFMLDFDMQVKPEEFALYRDSLRRETVVKEVAPVVSAVVRPPIQGPPIQVAKIPAVKMPAVKMPAVKMVSGMTYSYQTWQPLVTPALSHQMVMPITIVPVPRYSMMEPQHHNGIAAFPRLGHAKMGHHAITSAGTGPLRYGWPC
mmetsp:Transcript_72093/g.100174  ORF Transcript_72093/g.100174 Transcript_72093/m.100174 type:complete len:285 (-) Transcript_72093:110-964(-)